VEVFKKVDKIYKTFVGFTNIGLLIKFRSLAKMFRPRVPQMGSGGAI